MRFRTAVSTVLGCVLVTAAISKLLAPADFAEAVAAYRLIPTRLVDACSIGLIASELAIASALLAGMLPRVSLACAAGLFFAFAVATGTAMLRGLLIDCGCFGPLLSLPLWATFALDVSLLGMAVAALRSKTGPEGRLSQHERHAIEIKAIAILTVALIVAVALRVLPRDGSEVTASTHPASAPSGRLGLVSLGAYSPMLAAQSGGSLVPIHLERLPVLVIFSSPNCPKCKSDLSTLTVAVPIPVVIIMTGQPSEDFAFPEGAVVFYDEGGVGSRAIGITGFPTYVGLDGQGFITLLRVGGVGATVEGKSTVMQWIESVAATIR